jgi:hypothetical protein
VADDYSFHENSDWSLCGASTSVCCWTTGLCCDLCCEDWDD